MDLLLLKSLLEQARVRFAPGLTAAEFRKIEGTYSFIFPPDLREFLAYALPVSERWVNWRDASDALIRDWLNEPYDGICFDIEYNHFWWKDWGEKPASLQESFAVAKQSIDRAPKLIPIYSHRFVPDHPNFPGNPVYSVVQTDIICYGIDLEAYLQVEFHFSTPQYEPPKSERRIDFWSELIEWADPNAYQAG
jgi:hypothetical protein